MYPQVCAVTEAKPDIAERPKLQSTRPVLHHYIWYHSCPTSPVLPTTSIWTNSSLMESTKRPKVMGNNSTSCIIKILCFTCSQQYYEYFYKSSFDYPCFKPIILKTQWKGSQKVRAGWWCNNPLIWLHPDMISVLGVQLGHMLALNLYTQQMGRLGPPVHDHVFLYCMYYRKQVLYMIIYSSSKSCCLTRTMH